MHARGVFILALGDTYVFHFFLIGCLYKEDNFNDDIFHVRRHQLPFVVKIYFKIN